MTYQAISYPTIQAFLESVQPFLEQHESLNNLILGAAIRLVEHPDWAESPFFLTTIHDEAGAIVLAALMAPPRPMSLAWIESAPVEAVAALVQSLESNHWNPLGVTGPRALSECFAGLWAEARGLQKRVTMRQRVYELRAVLPPPPCPGFLRIAGQADLRTVMDWRRAFTEEAFSADAARSETVEAARRMAERGISTGSIFLWDDNGPVSMANRVRLTRHGATIGGVYTPPEHRRKGYAGACVAALSQRILDSGKSFCNLFTDLSNPTSNNIYQKIGYRPLGDFTVYRFESHLEK